MICHECNLYLSVLFSAGLNLAELYYRNEMIQESLSVYHRLTETYSIQSNIGWKARLELAKLVVFENHTTETVDQNTVYTWLNQMQSKPEKELAQVFEILGYCSENGIGVTISKKDALRWYICCIEQKEFDWAKQRSLCRLVNFYMDDQDYTSAFNYLQKLKPELDEMSQLSEDASIQARRMKYYLGKFTYFFRFCVMKKN